MLTWGGRGRGGGGGWESSKPKEIEEKEEKFNDTAEMVDKLRTRRKNRKRKREGGINYNLKDGG